MGELSHAAAVVPNNNKRALLSYGRLLPTFALTNEMSPAVIAPLVATSVRKLAAVTGLPDSALIWPTSDVFAVRFAVESPARIPIGMATFPKFTPSLTVFR